MEISLGMWIDAKHIIQMRQSLCILNVLRMLIDWEKGRKKRWKERESARARAESECAWNTRISSIRTYIIRYAPDTLEFSHRAALPSESLSRFEPHTIFSHFHLTDFILLKISAVTTSKNECCTMYNENWKKLVTIWPICRLMYATHNVNMMCHPEHEMATQNFSHTARCGKLLRFSFDWNASKAEYSLPCDKRQNHNEWINKAGDGSAGRYEIKREKSAQQRKRNFHSFSQQFFFWFCHSNESLRPCVCARASPVLIHQIYCDRIFSNSNAKVSCLIGLHSKNVVWLTQPCEWLWVRIQSFFRSSLWYGTEHISAHHLYDEIFLFCSLQLHSNRITFVHIEFIILVVWQDRFKSHILMNQFDLFDRSVEVFEWTRKKERIW